MQLFRSQKSAAGTLVTQAKKAARAKLADDDSDDSDSDNDGTHQTERDSGAHMDAIAEVVVQLHSLVMTLRIECSSFLHYVRSERWELSAESIQNVVVLRCACGIKSR